MQADNSSDARVSFFDYFSPYYLTNPAWHADQTMIGGGEIDLHASNNQIPTIPNLPYYAELLLGIDSYLLPLGIGITGLVGLLVMMLSQSNSNTQVSKRIRSIGIFGYYSTWAIFLTYIFYYYRSGRFFVPVAPFLVIGAMYLVYKILLVSTHTIKLLLLSYESV